MATYTSTLPDELLAQLDKVAKAFQLPKNKLIEKALTIYLDQLNKAEYVKSYKTAGDDVLVIAEEGMAAYCDDLLAE